MHESLLAGAPLDSRALSGEEHACRRERLSTRALVLGAVLAAFACVGVTFAEVVSQVQVAVLQFAPLAVGLLMLLVLTNLVLKAVSHRLALRASEIIVVYLMVLLSSLLASRGLHEKFLPTLVAYKYFATPANDWERLLVKPTPQWAVPFAVEESGPQPVVRYFYEGLPPGQSIPWAHWLGPAFMWFIPILLFFVVVFCLATILRRQWVDNERLSFPLALIPVELSRSGLQRGSWLRSPLLWGGFLIPNVVYALYGISANHLGRQTFPLTYDLSSHFVDLGKPWSDFGGAGIKFSLAAFGFFYFLPAELLLSLWSFFWLVRAENIAFSAAGVAPAGMPSYPTTVWNGYQSAGAYLVIIGYMLRSAWPYLRGLKEKLLAGAGFEERELLPLRVAIAGLIVSTAGIIIFFWRLGMIVPVAIFEAVVFLFVIVPVLARSVNEAGILQTETSFRPVDLIKMFRPMGTLPAGTLTGLYFTGAIFMRDQRGNMLATMLDGLKMSDLVRLDRRSLLYAGGAAVMISLLLGSYLHLVIPYRLGGVTLYGQVYTGGSHTWIATDTVAAMQMPPAVDRRLLFFFLSGVIVTLGTAILRMRYSAWPLAPLGFALAGSWSLSVYWFPLLMMWLVKVGVARFVGSRAYVAWRPFFYGLILGEFFQAILWAALAVGWHLIPPRLPFN